MFTTAKDKEQFDNWTKEEIYEAYLVEHRARLKLNKDCIVLSQALFDVNETVKEFKELFNEEQ